MVRTLCAALVGAIALYVCNTVYWMTIGREAVGVLADEAPVTAAIRDHVPAPGAYYFPGVPPGEITAEQQRDFVERHRRGPVGMLIVHPPGGGERIEPASVVTGLAIHLLTSALLTLVVRASSARGFLGRWVVAILMALAAAAGTHGLQWNTFHLPGRYSAFLAIAVAASWTLAGLVIAAVLSRGGRPAS